jgi:DNA-binding response OmpR family regulator
MAKTIMLVDDEVELLDMLKDMLVETGYEVVTAADGKDALRKVKITKPDLMILDVNMPKMDGAEVSLALKQNEATKNIPIIFLTALRSRDDGFGIEKNVGGIPTFAKPFDYDELLGKVREMLEKAAIKK